MTFSSLIKGTLPHHNKFSSRQGTPISRINQHHWASTGADGYKRLTDPAQQASVNYIIFGNGDIYGQVPEEYRAWTSGSFEADAPAITYEVQDSTGAVNGNDMDPKSWKITDKALAAIIRLNADIAKRHKWGSFTASRYRGHREFYPTACPGGYIWSKMGDIRAASHQLLVGNGKATAPVTPATSGKSVWELANDVMAGLYGSGDVRKKALGSKYAAVQAEVNRRLGIGSLAKKKTVSQLADEVIAGVYGSGSERKKKLGTQYAAVQAEVNRRLGASRPSVSSGPSISQLADAVLRGEYGDGETRKKKLGSKFAAVQAEVNRRLAR